MTEMRQRVGADERVLAILAFHKIGAAPGGWDTWNYIPESTFEAQLCFLREMGWEWIDAADLAAALHDPERLPRRAALLTFDDGYRSMRQVVLPILHRFGAPAVLFVPTAFVGGSNSFDAGVEPDEVMCDWADLRALEESGVSIQSHSVSHPRFSELSLAEQEEELRGSKATLEHELGKVVDLFAFPYGDDGENDEDRRALAGVLEHAGYRAACLYGGGPTRPPVTEPYRMTRLAMGPDSDLEAMLAP
jgi:peptidoglycan/xylan/chitin deacetylase (PgdA/CDA1 family)